jgi:hypothetical protein
VHGDPWVSLQPDLDLGMFVGDVVVSHDVQTLGWALATSLRHSGTRPSASLVTGVGDLAGGDLQGGEQGRGAVADASLVVLSGSPGHRGRIAAVRSKA